MGFIYLIRDRYTGLYKIGRSNDPERRLADLRKEYTKLPIEFDFYLAGVWETNYPVKMEKFAHESFEECRVRGEWFNLATMERHLEDGWGPNSTEYFIEWADECFFHVEFDFEKEEGALCHSKR